MKLDKIIVNIESIAPAFVRDGKQNLKLTEEAVVSILDQTLWRLNAHLSSKELHTLRTEYFGKEENAKVFYIKIKVSNDSLQVDNRFTLAHKNPDFEQDPTNKLKLNKKRAKSERPAILENNTFEIQLLVKKEYTNYLVHLLKTGFTLFNAGLRQRRAKGVFKINDMTQNGNEVKLFNTNDFTSFQEDLLASINIISKNNYLWDATDNSISPTTSHEDSTLSFIKKIYFKDFGLLAVDQLIYRIDNKTHETKNNPNLGGEIFVYDKYFGTIKPKLSSPFYASFTPLDTGLLGVFTVLNAIETKEEIKDGKKVKEFTNVKTDMAIYKYFIDTL